MMWFAQGPTTNRGIHWNRRNHITTNTEISAIRIYSQSRISPISDQTAQGPFPTIIAFCRQGALWCRRFATAEAMCLHRNIDGKLYMAVQQERFRNRLGKWVGSIRKDEESIQLLECTPLAIMHLALIGLFFVGFSWTAFWICFGLYFLRVFALTGGYHRYFSHSSYKTSRVFQFILAWVGASSAQMGPLWWASHHRHHHQYSDTEQDIHSPTRRGFFWSHIGWLLCRRYGAGELSRVQDYAKFPEIRFIDRFHSIPALGLGIGLFILGAALERSAPGLGTSGWQLVMWGFFLSTVLVYHVTFAVNSLTHMIGRARFDTGDDSRNSFLIAMLTFGEGWHNNHHRYPISTRQGFYWWEIDVTYYILKVLSWLRIVWDLRPPAPQVYVEANGGWQPADSP